MNNNNYSLEPERRGSRNRALERSFSYSEAILNSSVRSSIEIPNIGNTDVYTNEELKKQNSVSQSYVKGKEIARVTDNTAANESIEIESSSDEENFGLVMTIDVENNESPKTGGTRNVSDASTRPLVSSGPTEDTYDTIEIDGTISEYPQQSSTYEYQQSSYLTEPSSIPVGVNGFCTPYSKRRKKGVVHRRLHGRPLRSKRAVLKNGEENVPVRSNIPSKSLKYMRDIVNTVINSKWRFIIFMMVVAHVVFWLIFASIWYVVVSSYEDDIGDGRVHCVNGTSSFAGFLMMAVETQMTIGYGVRFPNEECPEAIVIMVFEIVAGTALSGGLTSLLFTKLVRPNRHISSVGFSRKATVCLRDGELCLQFRVWDLLNVHLVGSTITAYMMKPIRTLEGEMVQNYIHQLELKEARAFLIWPITVVHVINSESPLYDFSAQDMMDYRFELVVCLTGASKNMGTVTQSRTSYLSKEIIWGYRFKNVIKYSKKSEAYVIDVDNLNTVEEIGSPLCSASQLKIIKSASRNVLSTPLTLSPNLSMSPTFSSRDEKERDDSLPSSPVLLRNATQKSLGWSYIRKVENK